MNEDPPNVTSLDQFKKDKAGYISGYLICLACKHTWAGVAPVGTHEWECPKCKCQKGVPTTFIVSVHHQWKCICGCFIFSIKWPDKEVPQIYCVTCGTVQVGWDKC